MTFPTFEALTTQFMLHFRAQEYPQALELITREGPHFPADRAWADYWRMCAAARVDDRALLYAIAEQSLAEGHWYGPVLWRQTPSFQSLQGDPDFERLVAASRAAQEQDSPPTEAVLLTETPANHSAASPLLLALHGNQGNAVNTRPFWQAALGEGWALALGQSTQPLYKGAFVWDDLDASRATVTDHLSRLARELAFDPRRVVLGGHSMGGLVAIQMALEGAVPVRGFVANGPATPFADAPEALAALVGSAAERGLRGYLILGAADDSIEAQAIHNLAATLRAGGLACKLEIVPGAPHAFVPGYEAALRRGLAFVEG